MNVIKIKQIIPILLLIGGVMLFGACTEKSKSPEIEQPRVDSMTSEHKGSQPLDENGNVEKIQAENKKKSKPARKSELYQSSGLSGEFKGSMSPEDLQKLLPKQFRNFKTLPTSSSTIERDESIITLTKAQYYLASSKTVIVVDLIDYSPEKKVTTPIIYTKAPDLQNFEGALYKEIPNAVGYTTWNSVRNSGWIDLLYYGRYAVKVRAYGEDASIELCKTVLNLIDTSKLIDGKEY